MSLLHVYISLGLLQCETDPSTSDGINLPWGPQNSLASFVQERVIHVRRRGGDGGGGGGEGGDEGRE